MIGKYYFKKKNGKQYRLEKEPRGGNWFIYEGDSIIPIHHIAGKHMLESSAKSIAKRWVEENT